jgi:hypothetical protein
MTTLAIKLQEEELVGLPDWEVAEILNAPDPNLPATYGRINNGEVIAILIANNLWANILDKSKNSTNATEKSLCINIVDSLSLRDYTFDLEKELIRTSFTNMLTGAVSLGLMSQDIATLITGQAYRQQSWAEYNNIEVTPKIIGLARGGV